ncbi:MAG: hypothetical protein JW885_09030 [Deltaproteobacteria bacterium]|nr:hypothetical protein [Candidatus Zymogenaceae bacterium]
MRRILLPIMCVGMVLFLCACGVKAPPVPPSRVEPARVNNLSASLGENGAMLSWTVPKTNTDGSELTDLAGFSVLRRDVADEDLECRSCSGEFEKVYEFTLEAPGWAHVQGDDIAFEDSSLSAGITYTYVVVPFNTDGHTGSYSNPIDVYFGR